MKKTLQDRIADKTARMAIETLSSMKRTMCVKIVCGGDHPLYQAIMAEFTSPDSVVRIVSLDEDVFAERDRLAAKLETEDV